MSARIDGSVLKRRSLSMIGSIAQGLSGLQFSLVLQDLASSACSVSSACSSRDRVLGGILQTLTSPRPKGEPPQQPHKGCALFSRVRKPSAPNPHTYYSMPHNRVMEEQTTRLPPWDNSSEAGGLKCRVYRVPIRGM